MPLTLEKLFSPTVTTSFEFLDETVTCVWSPFRWTGEMQDLAEKVRIEIEEGKDEVIALREAGDEEAAKAREIALDMRDKRALREMLSTMLVSWDVLDGKKPVKTDLATLNKLPDTFLVAAFLSLSAENQADPSTAPSSDVSSVPTASSAHNPDGSSSSDPPTSLESRRGRSKPEPVEPDTTQSGVVGL